MPKQCNHKSLALIGAGRWGKNLARNFHHLNDLHTICDSNEALLDHYQEAYPEIQLTSNYNAILNNAEITRVAIAAPAVHHYSLAKLALNHHKDVYVEKPLCLNPSEAHELITLAKANNRILMVGHLLQYHPCIRKIQEILAEGTIGKVLSITCNRLNLGCIRTEENVLWSFAPHDISVILSLCGHQLPLSVSCTGTGHLTRNVADMTLTSLEFEGNIRAHIHTSWLHPHKEQKISVIGTQGMLHFDDLQPWDRKLTIVRNPIKWVQGRIPQANALQPEAISITQKEPLQEECQHFIDCCNTRTAPRTDGYEGLRVLQVLKAAQESLESHGKIVKPSTHSYFAHATADIDPLAQIGKGTKIWHFSHIMNDAKIGEDCNIGQNVVISPSVTLGNRVKIQNNVSVYSGVICEEDVFLGPGMVFTNVKNPRSHVNRRGEYAETYVRKGATIGANATIICGIEIGAYAFIGAGAVVTKNVKPYALMIGNPARQQGWMSRHGEKLNLPPHTESEERLIGVCPAKGDEYLLQGETLKPLEESLNVPIFSR